MSYRYSIQRVEASRPRSWPRRRASHKEN